MNLGELVTAESTPAGLTPRLAQLPVKGLDYDSRRVGPGFVFFAFPGANADGREFARQALEKGAVAIVSELPAPPGFDGPWVQVAHGRRALAGAAKRFYGNLDEKLILTGITGTNGKTTTCWLIDTILRNAGRTTMLAGTIEYHVAGKVVPAPNTTPESLDLQRLFSDLEAAGGTHATMEISSHALALGRSWGLHFHTAVFTNLTRDHLDFHQNMEAYFAAKQILFTGAGGPPPKFSVINRDDEWGRRLGEGITGSEIMWYGMGNDAAIRARSVHSSLAGLRFDISTGSTRFPVQSPMIGRINVYNILAAASAAMSLGISNETIARGVEACKGVPGRFERVDEGQPFAVIVDYSHTDDALRNAIAAARSLEPKRIITVFGAGGDRDRTKRPLMGQAASELSDMVIVTSDNPRSEDPLQIVNDVMVGVRRANAKTIVEVDRSAAIHRAIKEAATGDVVLLAGKGHETYQVFRDHTIHFDDREVAGEALRSFGYRRKDPLEQTA
jgi:UDP-N-acetylmuramoyl-L-alanyl-D-glutamate--2,6-diaminopimelate ligase